MTRFPRLPLPSALAFAALFAGQCADGPHDPPDAASLATSLEAGIAGAVEFAAERYKYFPRSYFERPGDEAVRDHGHFAVEVNDWGLVRRGDGELRAAAFAAARSLATTAPLGFETVDGDEWLRMPGCAPPELRELAASAPEPRPEGFRGDRFTLARLTVVRKPGGALGFVITFFRGPAKYWGCPPGPRPDTVGYSFPPRLWITARPTPEGWEYAPTPNPPQASVRSAPDGGVGAAAPAKSASSCANYMS